MKRRTLLAAAAALGASAAARAQQPAIPSVLTLMVPFPAGGVSDLYARAVAPRMAKELDCTVIVDNLAGASGSIAVARAMGRAASDMVVVGSPTEMILAPAMLQSARYKPEDFRPLALLSQSQLALYARADLPMGNVDELVAWARANRDKPLTYGSVGIGSIYHLAGQAFADAVGVPMNHVPYKGGAPGNTGERALPVTASTLGLPLATRWAMSPFAGSNTRSMCPPTRSCSRGAPPATWSWWARPRR